MSGGVTLINITLSALIRILAKNNIEFLVSKADHNFLASVLRFCTMPKIPQQHYTSKEWQDECFYDRYMGAEGQVCLHYHMEKQCIISICEKWREILKKEYDANKNKSNTTDKK